jgi:hypothetical protein
LLAKKFGIWGVLGSSFVIYSAVCLPPMWQIWKKIKYQRAD